MADQSLSVQKALAILSEIGSASEPITVAEIMARVGLGKTVVLRILATLSAQQVIERNPASGGYFVGPRLIQFAQKAMQQNPLIVRARPVLDEIVRVTSDAGLLMVLDGRESLCVDKVSSRTPVRTVGTEIGTRSPIHTGGGPFALLAYQDDAFVDEYLSQPLRKMTERTVTEPAAVRARIAEARERGFTIGNEDLFEYVVAVGVCIRTADGRLLGSLSIGGIGARYPHDRCIEVGETLTAMVKRQFGQTFNGSKT